MRSAHQLVLLALVLVPVLLLVLVLLLAVYALGTCRQAATAAWLGKILLVPFVQGVMVGAGTTIGQHLATNLLRRRATAASSPS